MSINRVIPIIIFSLSILSVLACKNSNTPNDEYHFSKEKIIQDSLVATETFFYDFNHADSIYILPSELNEISGLSWYQKEKSLLTINDEKGIVYQLDPGSGNIIDKIEFAKNGDFEGVSVLGDSVFIIKSKGDLYCIDLNSRLLIDKIKTPLKGRNDVEGLCSLSVQNSLLVACKGQPTIDSKENLKKSKAIYRFDLETNTVIKTPYLLIRDQDLLKWLDTSGNYESISKFSMKALKSRAGRFSPSGIAIHPDNRDIFILSSQGKLLCIFSPSGEIKHIQFFNASHTQPEGICFDNEGQLYISNESKGLRARLFTFKKIMN